MAAHTCTVPRLLDHYRIEIQSFANRHLIQFLALGIVVDPIEDLLVPEE